MKKILFSFFVLSGITATAQVKIGNNPTNLTSPASTTLELENPTSALLLNRVTSTAAVTTPVNGMIVYDLSTRCIRAYEDGAWSGCLSSPSNENTPGTIGIIPGNATCAAKNISVKSCASVSGANLNDDGTTALGTEYNWSSATSTVMGTGFGASTNTRALVEIGGQCWAKFNMNINNNKAAAVNDGVDRGSSGYYTGGPFANEGILYQWSSAMNLATTERAQGVCPTAWHVPSDCEWMYLENTLGMTVADQEINNAWRNTGTVGVDLSTLISGGTSNTSGFTGLLSGTGLYAPSFGSRGISTYWWSSSAASATTAYSRVLGSSNTGVNRNSTIKAYSFSVRCLKD